MMPGTVVAVGGGALMILMGLVFRGLPGWPTWLWIGGGAFLLAIPTALAWVRG